jgi:hypothetical protein
LKFLWNRRVSGTVEERNQTCALELQNAWMELERKRYCLSWSPMHDRTATKRDSS